MTLLVGWRSAAGLHMASDTRLTFGQKTVDLGIKIMSAPYRIYGPGDKDETNIVAEGDLGLGFAGSAVAALTLTATLRDVLITMQGAPGFTDFGLDGVVDLLWRTYDTQQNHLCAVMDKNGVAAVLVFGFCERQQKQRAFLLDVDACFQRRRREVLEDVGMVEFLGSGGPAARAALKAAPSLATVLPVVQAVIDDPSVPGVGGAPQYGELIGTAFRTLGVARASERNVHHWRGGLDLNDPELTRRSGLVLGYPLLDQIGVSIAARDRASETD